MNIVELNNQVKIPLVGLGVFQTKDGEETINAVRWALEAGYRHIDTANAYYNEAGVGTGIKESGVPREEIFITTKLWNEVIRQGKTKESFEESLKLLQVDYVDLYLIHWPADGYQKAWSDMEDLYKEGKIKAIGVSNFSKIHLGELEKTATVTPAVNQIESQPYFNNQEMIDYCHARGIAVEAWSPLGGTGGIVLQDPTLAKLAEKYGKSVAQIVIRWHMQRNVIVLPKSIHQERIVSNYDVFDFALSAEDMAIIQALDQNKRVGPDPDDFDF